ncbi:uncharacterized protein LOC143426333 [Xylocopa sonorina]|uniref:uncharacterized protein LOC143426333 n=1 Tax=Xylocopa sonorina TaxID=1818115 RepID=UPI00403A9DE3
MTLIYSNTDSTVLSRTVKFCTFFLTILILGQCGVSYNRPMCDPWSTDTNCSWIPLSTPAECARDCQDGGEPKNCYYSFNLEFYSANGPACNLTNKAECIKADGYERTVLSINRQLPGPLIKVCKNDRVIVDVHNGATGLEATIHWHGIFQNNFQYYDGVPYITQCPIASLSTFRYDFIVQNSGTHFYHSHVFTHMLDGQIGGLIVRDSPSNDPHRQLYDEDIHVIFLNDWMHALSFEYYPGYYGTLAYLGQTAQNILINGLGMWNEYNPTTNKNSSGDMSVFTVQKGKRYRIRMINSFSTVCLADLSIWGHRLNLIAQDGANVKPVVVDRIVSSTGERVDFILTADQNVDSYWIQVRGLGECENKTVQQLAILKYEGGPDRPSAPAPTYNDIVGGVVYNDLNASKCDTDDTSKVVCVNQVEDLDPETDLLKVEPDSRHILPFWFFNYTASDGDKQLFSKNSYEPFFDVNDGSQLLSTFNNISFETPPSNLLSQQSSYGTICKRNQLSTCTEPCTCAQVISVKLNSIVEIIVYDALPLKNLDHPFHLHGYEFKLFSIGQFPNRTTVTAEDMNEVIQQHTERLQNGGYHNPPGKDTAKIPMGGWVILRFKANNPGWWLFHCHFAWHHITGMELVVRVGEFYDLPPEPRGFPQCDNWRPALHTLNEFYSFTYPPE